MNGLFSLSGAGSISLKGDVVFGEIVESAGACPRSLVRLRKKSRFFAQYDWITALRGVEQLSEPFAFLKIRR